MNLAELHEVQRTLLHSQARHDSTPQELRSIAILLAEIAMQLSNIDEKLLTIAERQ